MNVANPCEMHRESLRPNRYADIPLNAQAGVAEGETSVGRAEPGELSLSLSHEEILAIRCDRSGNPHIGCPGRILEMRLGCRRDPFIVPFQHQVRAVESTDRGCICPGDH